jgi:hypothetical protein
MDDLTITRLCAEAMGVEDNCMSAGRDASSMFLYDPLHDDAQAMALVKRLRIRIIFPKAPGCAAAIDEWYSDHKIESVHFISRKDDDLNRAICECVANMMQSKGEP